MFQDSGPVDPCCPPSRPGENRRGSGIKSNSKRGFAQQAGIWVQRAPPPPPGQTGQEQEHTVLWRPGRTLQNRSSLPHPGTNRAPRHDSVLFCGGVDFVLTKLHLSPPPPPSIGTGACPEVKRVCFAKFPSLGCLRLGTLLLPALSVSSLVKLSS